MLASLAGVAIKHSFDHNLLTKNRNWDERLRVASTF